MNTNFIAQTIEAAEPGRASVLAYIGTYTGAKSKGIYVTRFDPATGSFSPASLAAETINPTFLALHPNKRWLYAVNETDRFEGKRTGSVSAFAVDRATGILTLINTKASGGTGPCHLSVDRSGKCLLVANYGSGSVAAYQIVADGGLSDAVAVIQHAGSSVDPQRQSGPHAHQILADPANRFVLACDLGLDQVRVSEFKPREALLQAHEPAAASVKPGSGPRHLTFHPNGRFVYLVNEMNSTLTTFAYDSKKGALTKKGTISTLPAGFKGNNSGAEIQVHPSGKFLYTSNRGDNSIAIFALDSHGTPAYIGRESTQGRTPRHFAIDSSGKWLIAENQESDSVQVFRVDKQTGLLAATGKKLEIGSPVCVVLLQ